MLPVLYHANGFETFFHPLPDLRSWNADIFRSRRDEEGNVENILTALDQVDLDVKQGQFVAILGHNGSGKSTLAKHLNVLLTAGGKGTAVLIKTAIGTKMEPAKVEKIVPILPSVPYPRHSA